MEQRATETKLLDRLGVIAFGLMYAIIILAIASTGAFGQTFKIGKPNLSPETKLWLRENYGDSNFTYKVFGTADNSGGGRVNMKLALARAQKVADFMRDSLKVEAIAYTLPVVKHYVRQVFIDKEPVAIVPALPQPEVVIDSLPILTAQLALQNSRRIDTLEVEIDFAKRRIAQFENQEFPREFGATLQVSRLFSSQKPRQQYGIGISYAVTSSVRMEVSVLLGGSYSDQNSDLGAKLFGRYRIDDWEIVGGGFYRAAGRRDGNLEDEKYIALGVGARYYVGMLFFEGTYSHEWQLDWHKEITLYTQTSYENRLSVGVGLVFE